MWCIVKYAQGAISVAAKRFGKGTNLVCLFAEAAAPAAPAGCHP